MDVVELGVLARTWAVEARRFAWLVGASASAVAGIPTAAQVLDDVLLRMYAEAFGPVMIAVAVVVGA